MAIQIDLNNYYKREQQSTSEISEQYVDQKISELTNGAPEILNTFQEVADFFRPES